jgi:hypothetical protein
MTGRANRRFLWVWLGGLALIVALVALAHLFPDRKTRLMKKAPGRDVVFPYGKQLDVVEVDSLGEAGAYVMRSYGTDQPDEVITGFYDPALAKLGFTRVATTDENPIFPGRMIAQYASGPFTFRLYVEKPPVRRGGVTYTTEFPRYFEAKLGD